jgi:lipopolysaccharide biosynthesis regulator YciM
MRPGRAAALGAKPRAGGRKDRQRPSYRCLRCEKVLDSGEGFFWCSPACREAALAEEQERRDRQRAAL